MVCVYTWVWSCARVYAGVCVRVCGARVCIHGCGIRAPTCAVLLLHLHQLLSHQVHLSGPLGLQATNFLVTLPEGCCVSGSTHPTIQITSDMTRRPIGKACHIRDPALKATPRTPHPHPTHRTSDPQAHIPDLPLTCLPDTRRRLCTCACPSPAPLPSCLQLLRSD